MKDVYKDYITVTWDAPESDGGMPITGYLIEKRDSRKSTFLKVEEVNGGTYEQKAGKLVEGNSYVFRVFAENEIGSSEPTTMEEAIKARLPFGKNITFSAVLLLLFLMVFYLSYFFPLDVAVVDFVLFGANNTTYFSTFLSFRPTWGPSESSGQ